ncbi:MAG TPA: restriction endonuclease [Candidatus Levybacteria bacterium]|nr:restriction endonuclease [Candidatus Levybacteria bacterium]
MAKNSEIYVIKQNGERELFSEEKVLRSMQRVGLDKSVQPKVLEHIRQRLHPEMETSEVFAHIREYLNDHNEHQASIKYNLKQAIFDLGPTGFPFERYMQRIFQEIGYTSDVNLILQGGCVTHEIDIMIEKDGKKEIIEAKFHNQQGVKTDVQVLLYTYARFLDVKETNPVEGVWVVTNTKLTLDASNYARCKGIKVIGWSYPETNNLQDYVEKPQLYPITILTTLSKQEKQSLIAGNVILCSDLLQISDHDLRDMYFLDDETIKKAKENAQMLTTINTKQPLPPMEI